MIPAPNDRCSHTPVAAPTRTGQSLDPAAIMVEHVGHLWHNSQCWQLLPPGFGDAPCLPYRLAEQLIKAPASARVEVKEAVEDWFVSVSLDDLFAVKNWSPTQQKVALTELSRLAPDEEPSVEEVAARSKRARAALAGEGAADA